jgi:hypothetical protein
MTNTFDKYLSDKQLHHYGVKGMRWGRRKYRIPDKSFIGKVSTYTERRAHYRKVAEAIKNSPKKHRIHRLVNGARNNFNEYAMSQMAYNYGVNTSRFGRNFSSKELANHPSYKKGYDINNKINSIVLPKTKGVRLND